MGELYIDMICRDEDLCILCYDKILLD